MSQPHSVIPKPGHGEMPTLAIACFQQGPQFAGLGWSIIPSLADLGEGHPFSVSRSMADGKPAGRTEGIVQTPKNTNTTILIDSPCFLCCGRCDWSWVIMSSWICDCNLWWALMSMSGTKGQRRPSWRATNCFGSFLSCSEHHSRFSNAVHRSSLLLHFNIDEQHCSTTLCIIITNYYI
jgi:hypothetical protein